MDSSIEEAVNLRAYAEKRFTERDFVGARYYASKAQTLCPQLEGIAQMVATFGVYAASETKIGGELDFYAILGLDPSVDMAKLKKQYRKMAVVLHPDKNRTVGADGAFKLVSDAFVLLSDRNKRNSYDQGRSYGGARAAGVTGLDTHSKSTDSHGKLDTFWTICTSCHVQYEYLRKYVNKRLSCKNCRGVFVAAETGAAPVNGSFPYCPWSYVAKNGYGSHGCTYVPASSSAYCAGNGISGHHSMQQSDYVSNMSFHWNSITEKSPAASDASRLSMPKGVVTHQENGKTSQTKSSWTHHYVETADLPSSRCTVYTEPPATKATRQPYKRRKFNSGSSYGVPGMETTGIATAITASTGNGNLQTNPRLSIASDNSARLCSAAPAFDARQLLIDKARTVIRKKLEEYKVEAAAALAKKKRRAEMDAYGLHKRNSSEPKKAGPMAISVPDSDFHDFDQDRSEDCFRPKQIWALYDEEDGMPRLYCLIRDIISVNPFKIYISYLSSKTDTEFGSVKWLQSGFTKSCGNFRVFNSDIVEEVNIFSHLLSREKAGRGGCVRIYPRSGDVWAVYRNWSLNWNRKTPYEVRHRYEMVVVLDDYSEERGVRVSPLFKLDGYKTVYQRNPNKDAIKWIPKREMLCFSHPVPSCLLRGVPNLPDGCWDLDPAATPDELLQKVPELEGEGLPSQISKSHATRCDPSPVETSAMVEESPMQTANQAPTPDDWPQML